MRVDVCERIGSIKVGPKKKNSKRITGISSLGVTNAWPHTSTHETAKVFFFFPFFVAQLKNICIHKPLNMQSSSEFLEYHQENKNEDAAIHHMGFVKPAIFNTEGL